jgi:hypothetical protein
MLVQGDDNLMRHPESQQFPWAKGMATLGFESEAMYRAQRENVEFCSSRLYEVKGGVTFGPKPGRVLAKLGYVINPPQGVSRESMLRGIALGLKKSSYFLPPIQTVIDRLLQLSEGHKAWFERKQFDAFKSDVVEETTSAGVMSSLNATYHWDYGTQSLFQESVAKMQLGDAYSPIVSLLLDRDCGGPQEIFGAMMPQMSEVTA